MNVEYTFKVTIQLSGQPPVPFVVGVGQTASPEDVAKAIVATLDDPEWRVQRSGDRVRVLACGKAQVTGITITGDGPKPIARRVLNLPAKK